MVSREEVLRVAKLAKLELRPQDLDRFAEQFGRILGYMELLQELDDPEVLPPAGVELRLRADEPRPGLTREQVLSAAPRSDDETILVPPVILPEEPA